MYRCLVYVFAFAFALISGCMRHHDQPFEVRAQDASVATPPPILSEGQHCTSSSNDASCDNLDGDCDGITDEDVPNIENLNASCSAGTGACRASGRWLCNEAGTRVVCSATPHLATTESCNGIDDDCNGVVDDIAATCLDSDNLQTCDSNGLSTYSCNTNDGNTCYLGSCTGSCIYGEAICIAGQNAYQFCQITGSISGGQQDCDDDKGGNDFEICRYNSSSDPCIRSPDISFGNYDSPDWTGTSTLNRDVWRVVPVTVTETMRLVALAAAAVNPGPAAFRAAIWTNTLNVFDQPQPGDLIWQSGLGNSLKEPLAKIEVTTSTILQPGTYWVGIAASSQIVIRMKGITDLPYVNANKVYVNLPSQSPSWVTFPDPTVPDYHSGYGIWLIGRSPN